MPRPAFVYLSGYPAAGKRTVGTELVRLGSERGYSFRLIDNHLINKPVLTAVGADGLRTLPRGVWSHVMRVREAVLNALAEFAPAEMSFVFTNVLLDDEPLDHAAVADLGRLAEARGAAFLPVSLVCPAEELARRANSPERTALLKWRDPEGIGRMPSEHPQLRFGEGSLTLDTSQMTPDVAARRVLDRLDS